MRPKRRIFFVIFMFAGILGILTYAIHQVFANNTPGIDFYVFWLASRAFFAHENPYTSELGKLAQLAIYREQAAAGQDLMEFAYPPFALFGLLPVSWMSFDWAQAAWMAFNILLVLTTSYLLVPRASKWVTLSFPFFYPFTFGYILGNFVVSVAACFLIFFRQVFNGGPIGKKGLILIGAAMAWTTIKPQFSWLFLIFFFLYGIKNRLWPMLAGFAGSFLAMVLLSFFFLPGWPLLWLRAIGAYQAYRDTTPEIVKFFQFVFPGLHLDFLFYPFFIAALVATAYFFYRWHRQSLDTLTLIAWCSFVVFFFHYETVAYEEVIFLIPLFLWMVLRKRSIPAIALWLGYWLFYYVYTLLLRLEILRVEFYNPPFLLFTIWLAWLMTRQREATAGA